MRQRWQPRVRERARKQAAASTGLVIRTRARFGFTAAPGTTDDARIRDLSLALRPTTQPGSSMRRTPARTSGSCAPWRPKRSARCTSATAAAVPRACTSSSRTSSKRSSTCSGARSKSACD